MPLYWLCYRHKDQVSVVIEPEASPFTQCELVYTAVARLGVFSQMEEWEMS
jgi:hypothetical protein